MDMHPSPEPSAEGGPGRAGQLQALILKGSSTGIAVIRNRVFETVNDRLGEILGVAAETLVGAPTRVACADPAGHDRWAAEALPRLALGQKAELELQLRRHDGSLVWCHLAGMALDPAQPDAGAVWFFEDLTERRAARNQLLETVHFHQTLLDAIPSPVFFKGADLRYQGCNRAMEAFLGLSREALVGRTAFDVAPPDLAEVYQAADAALLTSRSPQSYQTQVVSAQAGLRDVEFHKAVFCNLQEEVAGLVGVIQDITAREAAYRELAGTKALLEAVLDQSPIPIVVAGADRVLRTLNRAASGFFGMLDEPSPIGHTFESLPRSWAFLDASGAIVPAERTPLYRALAGEPSEPQEFRVRRKDGTERICQAFGMPIHDAEGRLLAGLAMYTDISAQRRAEETLRRVQTMESLGLMAEGLAHDFNNLFQGLGGLLELAQAQSTGEASALLGRATSLLGQAAGLSNQVLDHSGKSHREVGLLDLNQVVREEVELLADLGQHPPISLVLAGAIPDTEGDRSQIHRVLAALLRNALEASMGADRPVEVRTELISAEEATLESEGIWVTPPKSGLQLRLTVRDHGCGIAPEHLGRIFTPFYTSKEPGRGLGLAVALGLIRGHGAGLHVASAPGQGSCFQVCLPLHERQRPPEEPVRAPLRGRTVLLVDDDLLILEVTGLVIANILKLPLLKASDGQEAVELFRRHEAEIGLVVMDATMPRMTGPEAFESMKRLRPGLQAILCSGYSDAFGEATAASLGFMAFLKKPFPLKDLKEAMEKALGPLDS